MKGQPTKNSKFLRIGVVGYRRTFLKIGLNIKMPNRVKSSPVPIGPVAGIGKGSVGVGDGVSVGKDVGVSVGVFVGVSVGVSVGVFVGVSVGVSVGVFVGVSVGVFVGVSVGGGGQK